MSSAYDLYEHEQQKHLAKLPMCYCCGEPIDDDTLFDIDGRLYHTDCMYHEYQFDTVSYIRGWRE